MCEWNFPCRKAQNLLNPNRGGVFPTDSWEYELRYFSPSRLLLKPLWVESQSCPPSSCVCGLMLPWKQGTGGTGATYGRGAALSHLFHQPGWKRADVMMESIKGIWMHYNRWTGSERKRVRETQWWLVGSATQEWSIFFPYYYLHASSGWFWNTMWLKIRSYTEGFFGRTCYRMSPDVFIFFDDEWCSVVL